MWTVTFRVIGASWGILKQFLNCCNKNTGGKQFTATRYKKICEQEGGSDEIRQKESPTTTSGVSKTGICGVRTELWLHTRRKYKHKDKRLKTQDHNSGSFSAAMKGIARGGERETTLPPLGWDLH